MLQAEVIGMAEASKKKFVVVLRSAPPIVIECDGYWLDPATRMYRFFDSHGTPKKKDDRDIATLTDCDVTGVVPAERFSTIK